MAYDIVELFREMGTETPDEGASMTAAGHAERNDYAVALVLAAGQAHVLDGQG